LCLAIYVSHAIQKVFTIVNKRIKHSLKLTKEKIWKLRDSSSAFGLTDFVETVCGNRSNRPHIIHGAWDFKAFALPVWKLV